MAGCVRILSPDGGIEQSDRMESAQSHHAVQLQRFSLGIGKAMIGQPLLDSQNIDCRFGCRDGRSTTC